jgi:hypothetical protein
LAVPLVGIDQAPVSISLDDQIAFGRFLARSALELTRRGLDQRSIVD